MLERVSPSVRHGIEVHQTHRNGVGGDWIRLANEQSRLRQLPRALALSLQGIILLHRQFAGRLLRHDAGFGNAKIRVMLNRDSLIWWARRDLNLLPRDYESL